MQYLHIYTRTYVRKKIKFIYLIIAMQVINLLKYNHKGESL